MKKVSEVPNKPKSEVKDRAVLPSEIKKIGTKFGSTSEKIRGLTKLSWSRREIADVLGISYQHVNNVQSYPLRKK